MRTILYISLLLLTLSACKAPQTVLTERTLTDTVFVREEIVMRDTVFYTDTAKAEVKLTLPQLINTSHIVREKNQARLIIKKILDTVYIECICDTIAIEAQLRNKIIHEINKRTEHIETTRIVEKKYTPAVVKILAFIGAGMLALIGITAIMKYKKII